VLGSGVLGGVLGLVPLAAIDAGTVPTAAWLLFCGADVGFRWHHFRRVRRLSLNADLELQLDVRGQGWRPARVLDGTAVFGDTVWLRYRDGGGRNGAELLFGRRRVCPGWRRFTVLLRLAERPAKG